MRADPQPHAFMMFYSAHARGILKTRQASGSSLHRMAAEKTATMDKVTKAIQRHTLKEAGCTSTKAQAATRLT